MSKLVFGCSVWWLLIYFYWFQGIIASVWWNFYGRHWHRNRWNDKENSNKNLKFTLITVLSAIPFVRFSCRDIIIVWPVSRQQVLYDKEKKPLLFGKTSNMSTWAHIHTHTLCLENTWTVVHSFAWALHIVSYTFRETPLYLRECERKFETKCFYYWTFSWNEKHECSKVMLFDWGKVVKWNH